MRLITIVITLSIFLYTQNTYAQDQSDTHRQGFVFGASLGVAHSTLDFPSQSESFTDLGLEFKVGYMLNPKLAILLTSNVAIYDYTGFGRDRKRDFGVLSPSIQFWPNERLWILGGLGIGGDNPVFWDIKDVDNDPLETKYYFGIGVVSGLGYELFKINDRIVIDIKARAMYRKVELEEGNTSGFSYGLLLGFNFY